MKVELGSIWIHKETGTRLVVLDVEDSTVLTRNGYVQVTDAQEQVAQALAEYARAVRQK